MKQLITSAQNITGSWVDVGSPIETRQFNRLGIWVDLDINDSLNVQIRALAQRTSAGGTGDEYVFPIKVISASAVNVQDEYIEFSDDADQKVILSLELFKLVPWIQIQVQAGTAGATPGQLDQVHYSDDNVNSFN